MFQSWHSAKPWHVSITTYLSRTQDEFQRCISHCLSFFPAAVIKITWYSTQNDKSSRWKMSPFHLFIYHNSLMRKTLHKAAIFPAGLKIDCMDWMLLHLGGEICTSENIETCQQTPLIETFILRSTGICTTHVSFSVTFKI